MNPQHNDSHRHSGNNTPHTSRNDAQKARVSRHAEVAPNAIYTCPMQPEVRQIGPGHCPKCGMALEPLLPSGSEDDSEVRRVRRRFWFALTLALPGMLIAMGPHVLGRLINPDTAWTLRLLEVLFSAPVVLWAAVPYYRRGWLGVVHGTPNMYTLIGLGVIVAFTYSLIATFLPQSNTLHACAGWRAAQ